MSIPVIICPCISRFDLLEEQIASVDYPVDRFVVVDNSCAGWQSRVGNGYIRSLEYIRPILNLGYPGGINAGLFQTPDAPWWIFTNADIRYGPGALARTDQVMSEARGPLFFTNINAAYAFGALNREAVKVVGMFDEWSCYPAYFDDNDWDYRRTLAGVARIDEEVGVHHGDDDGRGSLTIRSDSRYRLANDRTFATNRSNYLAKWGGLPGEEKFTTPWNSGLPLWALRPDIDGVRDRRW